MADRLRDEIEELLARLDTFPPPRPLWKRAADSVAGFFHSMRRGLSGARLPNVTAGHVLLASIVVIVIAYLALGGSELQRWLIAGGIAAFIAAFLFSLRRQSRPPQKMWRDRPLDLRPGNHPPGDRRRSWWDRWRNRR